MNALHGSLSTFLFFLTLRFSISMDTITPGNSIKDGNVLVSSGGNFALGFFCPDTARSTPRYLGIWYHKVSEPTVVWVANRDKPLNDSSGVLTINNQGSLVIYATNQSFPLWSSDNNSALALNNSMAQLLDTGNLVLLHQDSKRVLWQSFDYPTDTVLPNMKLGLDMRTGLDRFLLSWKSKDDPGTGDIYYRIDPTGYPQLFLYKGSQKWWRGGPWTGQRWSGVPEMIRNYIFNVSFVNNKDEVSIMYRTNSTIISKMSINESGFPQRSIWNGHEHRWIGIWSSPKDPCDKYNECGPNSICDLYNPAAFICQCLPGYEPKSPRNWDIRDGSGGCIRKADVSVCRSGEGFTKVAPVRVPDTSVALADMNLNLKACKQECLKNCSCTAYTSADERGFGCLMWYGDLVDTRTYSNIGQDIYIRVDAKEFAKNRTSSTLAKPGMKAGLIISIAVAFFLTVVAVFWWISRKKKEFLFSCSGTIRRFFRRNIKFCFRGQHALERWSRFQFSSTVKERWKEFDFRFTSSYLGDSPREMELNESRRPSDLPLFDLSTIAAATNNFSLTNKLGQGGFGSVYKGILTNGREIAIKRLSKNSGQGIQEFKTEVALIAKLQHRNLVRIVGCCIHDKEKMLIYEYLPNKSLDSFIFDKTRGSLLDWTTRFNIVCGIARGMLYLHQDSRLRIIHRDLKASNVLLDDSMNPKISDFGMAKIVGVDQIETNTKRIVGTYGYMSPEYAMQGLFSVKSDVYSFGVLLLEIVTGRKNNSYYQESSYSNMVGYVWDQWKEGSAMEVVDLSLTGPYPEHEVLRCIHIGLLCVQDSAVDRPTMSTVVFLLSNDTILPPPKQPAFIFTKTYDSGDPSTSEGAPSLNDVTVSSVQAR